MKVIVSLVVILSAVLLVRPQDINVTLSPSQRRVGEGETANFTCSPFLADLAASLLNTIAPGSTDPESTSDNPRVSFMNVNDDSARVFFWANATREDDGRQFSCQVGSFTSNRATLFVSFPPSFTIADTNIDLEAGESLTISVNELKGSPNPTITWTRDGVDITSMTTGGGLRLSVGSVGVIDNGTYEVTATNALDSLTITITVIVTSAPMFVEDEDGDGRLTLSFREGENASISCAALANPPLTSLNLTMGGRMLNLTDDGTFTIENVQSNSVGLYVCSATNTIGDNTLSVTLEVGMLPGKVSNVRVTPKPAGVEVDWDAAEERGSAITRYTVTVQNQDRSIEKNVTSGTSATFTREELGIPDSGDTVDLTITIIAVNGIGPGESYEVVHEVKFEPVVSTTGTPPTSGSATSPTTASPSPSGASSVSSTSIVLQLLCLYTLFQFL